MLPLVRDFLVQNASVLVVELLDLIDTVRVLGYQRAFDEVVTDIAKIVVRSELFDIRDQLSLGNSGERVLDSTMVSAPVYRGRLVTDSPVTLWVSAATLALRRASSWKMEALRAFSSGSMSVGWNVSVVCSTCGLQLIVSNYCH